LSTGNPPAGYYADPSVPGYIRYWDGNEWMAGTSQPAPAEVAEQQSNDSWQPEPAGVVAGQERQQQRQRQRQQDDGLIQSGARGYGGQVQPQRYVPTPTPTPVPVQQPQPEPAFVADEFPADEFPESVGTMIVPSAFAHGVRNVGGYNFPGQSSNPFAGLPGSAEFVAAEAERAAAETKVVELASPGSRFLARIIDLGIAVVFSAPITITLLLIAHRHDHQYVLKLDAEATTTYTTLGMDALGIALWAGALLALVIVSVVYEGFRLGRGGQTIGKRLAGVRVVGLPDGTPLGKGGVSTRRALLFWVFAIIPAVDVATLGGVFWGRPYRQGAHEKATSTVTIKA